MLANTFANIVAGLGLAVVGATYALALTQPAEWQAQSPVVRFGVPVFAVACLMILGTSQ